MIVYDFPMIVHNFSNKMYGKHCANAIHLWIRFWSLREHMGNNKHMCILEATLRI